MRRSDPRPAPPGAAASLAVTLAFDGAPKDVERPVPVETPVQVVYANLPFAVMMMTPCDLEDFAVGFSLTEGIIAGSDDVRSLVVEPEPLGLQLRIELVSSRLQEHLARRRNMAGRTGCGLCGIDDFAALPRALAPVAAAPDVRLTAIRRALGELEERQSLNRATHAVHAAAWADLDGAIVAVREDVGRHNALDKLIGSLLRSGVRPERGFAVITSRVSYEMVEKTAAFGARTLVAISAPTSLALERARRLDLTLVGIARRDSVTVFHGRERILTEAVFA